MIEAEAKNKRCWQSGGGPLGGPCAGADCMAWRESHVRRTFMVQAKGKHSEYEEWHWDPRKKPEYEHLPTKDGVIEPHGNCLFSVCR